MAKKNKTTLGFAIFFLIFGLMFLLLRLYNGAAGTLFLAIILWVKYKYPKNED